MGAGIDDAGDIVQLVHKAGRVDEIGGIKSNGDIEIDDMIPVITQVPGLNIGYLPVDDQHPGDKNDRQGELKNDKTLSRPQFGKGSLYRSFEDSHGPESGKVKGRIAAGEEPGE